MSDWRDVSAARVAADELETNALDSLRLPALRDDAIVAALLAVRAEIRALATVIDYGRTA